MNEGQRSNVCRRRQAPSDEDGGCIDGSVLHWARAYALNPDSCEGDGLLSSLVITIFRILAIYATDEMYYILLFPTALDIMPCLSLVYPSPYCINCVSVD